MSKLTEFPDKLLSSERLESDQRRRFVRAVVDEIRKTSKHFPKRQFEEIASQIVKMYPNNFEDRIDKIRVGSGYASLMQQLISRNENLNRKHPKEKKDTSLHVEKVNEQGKMRKRKSIYDTDTYGCVSWGPHISTEEEEIQETLRKELQDMYGNDQFDNVIENMKKTYPLQRQNINEGKTLKLLLDEWPFLVQENVMMQHCEELLGIKLQEALGEMYLKKGVRMLKFFQSRKDANSVLKKYLDEVEEEKEMDNVVALLPATIQCLQAYLGEKENSLFLIMDEMSSPEEVERSNEKNWPRLAMLGPSAMSAKQSMLLVDGRVIGRYSSFVTAFALLFGAYYMFNIEYPSEAAVTLEFAQRCFFGINPESGCKTAKKKKTSDTHAKVLKLLKDLADYEWKDI